MKTYPDEITGTEPRLNSVEIMARLEYLEDELEELEAAEATAREAVAVADAALLRVQAQWAAQDPARVPSVQDIIDTDIDRAKAESDDAGADVAACEAAVTEWIAEYGEELQALRGLCDYAPGYAPDWRYGAELIRDEEFEDFARELAEDCGTVPDDATWPMTCIDWERAASELKQDYTALEFRGSTYWVR